MSWVAFASTCGELSLWASRFRLVTYSRRVSATPKILWVADSRCKHRQKNSRSNQELRQHCILTRILGEEDCVWSSCRPTCIYGREGFVDVWRVSLGSTAMTTDYGEATNEVSLIDSKPNNRHNVCRIIQYTIWLSVTKPGGWLIILTSPLPKWWRGMSKGKAPQSLRRSFPLYCLCPWWNRDRIKRWRVSTSGSFSYVSNVTFPRWRWNATSSARMLHKSINHLSTSAAGWLPSCPWYGIADNTENFRPEASLLQARRSLQLTG